MTGAGLRFCIQVPQDAPFPQLRERWRRCEELGFDAVYVADHAADPRQVRGPWLHGWATLAALATATTAVRVGVLVSSPVLHHPAMLARAAVTLDQLSGGRLELGLGTGIAGLDHAATGTPYWGPKERVERFAEFVDLVDAWLRADRPVDHVGRYYKSSGAPVAPGPVQRPRPPIIVAGQSPTVLRVAARQADVWNTHGPFGADLDEVMAATARQNRRLDELCEAAGRDPVTLRRSLLLLETDLNPRARLDMWASPGAFEEVVMRFRDVGITEFVVFWPRPDHMDRLERAATETMPALHRG